MATARKLSPVKKVDSRNNAENESTISGGYDPFKQSNLFHEVYLNVEVPHKFKDIWEPRDPKEFDHFCNAFRNLCAEYDFKDFDSWSEIDTIQNWIIPVLHMLGYYDKCEGTAKPFSLDTAFTYEKKSLRPDFIIVDRPSDLKRIKDSDNSPEQKLSEAREYVKLTIEAKYWDRLEEYKQNKVEDKKRADNKKANAHETKDPVEQALEYMKMLHNDWGILTDGKVWRLYHRELSNDSQKRCFQFNLGYLAKFAQEGLSSDSEEQKLFTENAKYFFYLFNKNALFGKEGKGKLLDHLIEYSKEYVHKIEDDLRVRFVQAMTTFCNGLHESMGKPKGEEKLDLIRNVAESHLFNIMFIKSCESRLILPMKADYLGRSLTRMVQCLKRYKPERQFDDHNLEMLQSAFGNQSDENSFKFTWDGTELYERLIDLTEFVQKGTNSKFKNFKIEGFTETVFTKEEWAIAQKYKVSNKHMVAALFEIGYAKPDPKINKYQQIPYNFFTARQLGSIYESFLEFKIDFAEEDIAFIKKQWQKANIKSQKVIELDVPVAPKGSLYFTPNNEKRKATGTYYTPDCVVQYIVEETLNPLVKDKKANQIAKLRVCDPAMGSGHFINASLNYLAKKYLEAFEDENYEDQSITLQDAKREVLHNCIFGVDINPRATKLTKMGLWLESAKAGAKLEELDDQIKSANSLTNYKLWKNEWKFLDEGIDAVVGNPPYLGEKGHKEIFQPIANEWLGKRFYLGKMDMFYFFFHLGLEILKVNGRLGFITTNYYITAAGGSKLRKDLYERANISKLVNLNELRVFGEAKGQHNLITFLDKNSSNLDHETEIIASDESGFCTEVLLKQITQKKSENTQYNFVKKSNLYDGKEFYIRFIDDSKNASKSGSKDILSKIAGSNSLLGELFNVNNGVFTGADTIKQKNIEKFKLKGVVEGDGVFILNKNQLQKISPNKKEMALIKPLFKNSDIQKFSTNLKNELFLINLRYTDRPKLEDYPNLEKHFSKFKSFLSSRPQTGTLQSAFANDMWYVMSTSRKLNFDGSKIVFPQRSKTNTFGFNNSTWYAASDVFFITEKDQPTLSIKYILGLLNSKACYYWLYFRGKRKGDMLELIGNPVSEIPIQIVEKQVESRISKLSDSLIKNFNKKDWDQLNSEIYSIYNFTKKEIEIIEQFYDKMCGAKRTDLSNEIAA